MSNLKISLAFTAVLLLAGCAHPLQITPNMARLERPADAKPKIKANVAYYVDQSRRNEEKTTPGGGGDKVTTMPYRDMETGFYKMLTNAFEHVAIMSKPNDRDLISKEQISYIITPTVLANSSSSNPLMWPPTYFSIDLICEIGDANGKLIDTKRVVGTGNAGYGDYAREFGLTGRLAMEDALLKMQQRLLEMPQPAAGGESHVSSK
jgi:hypothetical protein